MKGKILSTAVAVFRDERVKLPSCSFTELSVPKLGRAHLQYLGRTKANILKCFLSITWPHRQSNICCVFALYLYFLVFMEVKNEML